MIFQNENNIFTSVNVVLLNAEGKKLTGICQKICFKHNW